MYATHKRTGFRCVVEREDLAGDRYFCNFGERVNPWTWVVGEELDFDSIVAAACDGHDEPGEREQITRAVRGVLFN